MCGLDSQVGMHTCWHHSPKNSQAREYSESVRVAAAMELMNSTDMAVAALVRLMKGANSEAIMLRAATEVLDRGGVRAGVDVNVHAEITDTRAADVLNDRLAKLATASERQRDGQNLPALVAVPDTAEDDDELDTDVIEGEIVSADEFPVGYLGRVSRLADLAVPPEDDTE